MATAALKVSTNTSARTWFVAAIFTGSFLLFLMQPMVARMALPRLGGAPAVWNSAMLVYQALLLGGYGYAHFIGRLRPRVQGIMHIALLVLAAMWLPLALIATEMPVNASPIVWVPWLLAGSIGLPFFAIAAQAPLLQRWFSIREPEANPYALYAASNLGSFGGLIAYPLLVEPLMPLARQSIAWTVGYGLLLLLVICCVNLLPQQSDGPRVSTAIRTASPTMRQRLLWIALAAVPSGLILSTTSHLTTDIIAMPLLWVLPLGLYLLSFIFAFSDRSRFAGAMIWAFPLVMIVAGAMGGSGQVFTLSSSIAADLLLLFVTSVALHRRLYLLRPETSHLTDFYLCMSIGGVLGGLFCALVAPAIFDWLYEYPLLVVAAALLMPLRADARKLAGVQRWLVGPVVLMLSLMAGATLPGIPPLLSKAVALVLIAGMARAVIAHRVLFAISIASLILGLGAWNSILISLDGHIRTRSYFGIYTVQDKDGARILVHGTTTHGTQILKPGLETYPTNYYAPRSGVGIAMRAVPNLYGAGARIGVVGLGAGTLACYAQPGQDWHFYEIDPAIAKIARDTRSFTFLSRCLPNARIEIGDARLTLDRSPASSADVLVIDAFSSDSIPMHLLTREAIANYGRVLSPDGLLLFHISNRYIDLKPVLAAAAREDGWHAAIRDYQPSPADAKYQVGRSLWVAFSRSPEMLRRMKASDSRDGWNALEGRPDFTAWTDDYGSILPLLHRP